MSGDLLRRNAISGDTDNLKSLLEQGSNPCSKDAFGLTALHYATWNGHVRCVEILCVNDIGRDEAGQQRSCIDLQTCRGYTALHLAALDGVEGAQCIDVLVSAGAGRGLRDLDGKTALDLALTADRTECIHTLSVKSGDAEDIERNRRKMGAKLRVQKAQVTPGSSDEQKERRAVKPATLTMHEHEIVPFSETNFRGKHAKETIQNLVLAKNQASINERRRKALADSQHNAVRQALDTKFI